LLLTGDYTNYGKTENFGRVSVVCHGWANCPILAILAIREISNLRVLNTVSHSDSRRLNHLKTIFVLTGAAVATDCENSHRPTGV